MELDDAPRRQKRAIFFVFDGGTGLGHLRRLSSIARAMQGEFSCLIVTSHRAAAHWFVPPECEYIHLPAWDSLLPEKAAYWGREPFLLLAPEAALGFRSDLLHGIMAAFKPDVVFVDHLPLGMRDELEDIIANTGCLKYLVTRGVQNETEDLARLLFAGRALEAVEHHYHRVFLAIDPQVFDFGKRYPDFDGVAGKILPVGYVVEPVERAAIAMRRKARGLKDGDIWTVASAGGGQTGEALIAASCALAAAHRDVAFDIVIGPRSRLSRADLAAQAAAAGNVVLHEQAQDMHLLHASADIVITSGGYNSMLETLQGKARMICVPNRKSERDEQYLHAASLGAMVAIDSDLDVTRLPAMFDRALAGLGDASADRRDELDFAGAANIKRIVSADLGLIDGAAPPGEPPFRAAMP